MLEDIIRKLLKAPPSQRRILADLTVMADETRPWRDKVIPWEEEREMELLSLNREYKWVKQSFNRLLKGVFHSIYHEPMLTYAYKNYIKGGHFALFYAATLSHQFIYQKQKTRTDFFIDGEHVGYLTPEWLMYSHRRRLLGRRNRFSDDYFTVVVWDREVAHMRDPRRVDRVNPRAFEIMDSLNDKEELLLMAIAFLTMIERSHGLDIG
ncbi:MAG TPA: hypothetical protein VI603_16605 [Saprospiraceae bacterium]|nr:hypothetical protein [Saprospiraceae bacterium]